MKLKILDDYSSLSAAAARMIIDCIKNKPDATLCFATGDSPKLTYQMVVEIAGNEAVDFSKCVFIGLDEWLAIPPDNPGSCHYFLHHYLFKPLGITESQIHLFDAMTNNTDAECKKMNSLVSRKNGIDFMLVGVGLNGHIGFNEPGTDFNSMAHLSQLNEKTKTVSQKYFNEPVVINKGLTLGLKQVMEAGTLLMIANGKKKAAIINKVVKGEITGEVPASFLHKHKNALVMIDREAASELEP
jgi:glucosamine-6-phosphate isomerase